MASVQSILNTASQYLGTQDYRNYCEAFVEQATQGHTGVYPSAIQAWMAQRNNAVQGIQGIQPGDTIYFGADSSNGGYGHTGVYIGNGQFISATYNGVKQTDLTSWLKSTGQQLLGYVPSGGEGRGIVQSAQDSGKMLNGQMQQAKSTPDNQMAQLLQQFKTQQHIKQSEQLIAQKQQEAQGWMQQQPKQQNTIPNVSAVPQSTPSQQPTYPYGQYLNTPSTASLPKPPVVSTTTNQSVTKPTDYAKAQTDYSKPQIAYQ